MVESYSYAEYRADEDARLRERHLREMLIDSLAGLSGGQAREALIEIVASGDSAETDALVTRALGWDE